MRKFYSISLSVLIGLSIPTQAAQASADRRPIVIEPENPAVTIYAVNSVTSNRGVYTISVGETVTTSKISGTTYIQYDCDKSGGTFVSKETLYGTFDRGYSVYAFKATAAGNENGSWYHSYYGYRDAAFTDYTWEIVAFDMTYDGLSGNIYGSFKGDKNGDTSRLCIYDGENHTVTTIGNFSTIITAIAADASGRLWGIAGNEGNLYRIGKGDGSLELVGSLGVTANGKNQSAAIDAWSGKLYWGATTSSEASLYEVDLNECTATKLHTFNYSTEQYNAFYIAAPDAPANAPAAAENLTATFTGTGTDVEISFTAPSQTVDGSDLSGELDYTIEIDGEAIENGTGKATAGEPVTKVLTLTEGLRTVTVTCSNANGNGPKAAAEVFAGFDTPGSVTNLVVTSEGNHVTLTWDVPTGKNGGTPDPAKLSYSVTRNPGAVEVANTSDTSAEDNIPEATISEYTYTVTVIYDGVAGESIESDALLIGNPYTVPYTQDFENAESFADIAFKVIDMNPNTNSWELTEADGNKFAQVKGGYYTTRSDYLYVAPILFETRINYTLKFKMANNSSWDGTQVRIFLSKSQSSNESDFITPYINSNFSQTGSDQNLFVENEMNFTVEETGVYCLGFYDYGPYYTSNNISLDDIEITSDKKVDGIDSAHADNTSINAFNGTLTVTGAEGLDITIHSTDGRLVGRSHNHGHAYATLLASGIYVVTVGSHSYKVNL